VVSRAQAKVQKAATAAENAALNSDPVLIAIASMTPAQIETYIDANVTTLAGARKVLKGMSKMIARLARNELKL